MTSSSVNQNDVVGGTLTRLTYVGDTLVQTRLYGRSAATIKRLRPASSSSPVRADMTRAPRGWTHSGLRITNALGECTFTSGASRYVFQGRISNGTEYSGFQPETVEVERLLNVARIQALGSAIERTQQLGEALRQARSSSRMVGDFASGFARGLDDLMEGGLKKLGPMSKWKQIPGKYLEYLYGWAPLGDDIANVLGHLYDLRNRGIAAQLTLKSTKQSKNRSVSTPAGYVQGDNNGFWNWIPIFHDSSLARVSYVYQLPQWWMDEMPIVAPFSTEWAMLPYSFVLDWVLPIGDWLMAVEAAQLSPFFKEGSETRMVRRTVSARINLTNPSWTPTIMVYQPLRATSFSMHRTAISVPPSVLMRPPSLRNPLSLNHLAQGLALLTQSFKRWA